VFNDVVTADQSRVGIDKSEQVRAERRIIHGVGK
jgi:hypothetical protein